MAHGPWSFSLAAELDPRMVPPLNGVHGRLPSLPPTPAQDATKTFRVLNGFRMDLLAAEPLVAITVEQMADLIAFLLSAPYPQSHEAIVTALA